jgi:hypothetical protein
LGRTPVTYTPTTLAGVEGRDERRARLAAEHANQTPPGAARLWGLPELDDPDDMWVDITGAEVITGLKETNIRTRLARSERHPVPFPAPHMYFRLNLWPMSAIKRWDAERREVENQS